MILTKKHGTRSKKRRNDKSVVCEMWEKRCHWRKNAKIREKRNSMSRVWDRKKEAIAELGRSSMPYRGKSIVE